MLRKRLSILAVTAANLALGTSLASAQLQFWTTEEQPDRLAKQEQMAADFEEQTGTAVEVVPVTESELGTRATAAFAAGNLPDVIYHTLQYVLPWAEAGILDVEANNEVVENLGRDTFAPGPLEAAAFQGQTAAVPVDGWTQLILYRQDLFEEAGLEAPDSYADIQAAIEELHNPPEMFGFVAATDISDNYMSQAIEFFFLANGLSPVSEEGSVGFDEDKLVESLEFYKSLAEASPPGDLYWQQSRELYFAGRAAMIMWSPFILDELAGLRDSDPPAINDDPTSTELAERTGIVTKIVGPSNPDSISWADLRYFGVTADADTDPAMEFVEYSMGEGYEATLSIAPEGKFPVRRGTRENPDEYAEAWSTLPVGVDRQAALGDIYEQEDIDNIITGLETAQRWGIEENRLATASRILNTTILNRLVREYLDGERDARATASLINEEIADIE